MAGEKPAAEKADLIVVEQNSEGVARHKQKGREFKLSVVCIVLALSVGLGMLLSGILDHDMPLWRRALVFLIPSAIELVVGVILVHDHLKEFGLSLPKIENQETPKLELSTDYPQEDH